MWYFPSTLAVVVLQAEPMAAPRKDCKECFRGKVRFSSAKSLTLPLRPCIGTYLGWIPVYYGEGKKDLAHTVITYPTHGSFRDLAHYNR